MYKRNAIVFIILVPLIMVFLLGAASAHAAQGVFKFIHMTDTHIGSGPGNKFTSLVVKDILDNYSDAQFIVHGGDVTELGMPGEYQYYKELMQPLNKSIIHTLGNHESRWTDAGKGLFEASFGKGYTSWDYGGIHFITLDTSIALGQHGHLEKEMLEWLKKDLSKAGKTTPVIIFPHHPIFFDESIDAGKFMDNDWELWPIIKDYNIAAIFTGHGHKDLLWVMNGITCIMTKAVMNGGYSVVEIDKGQQEIRVYNRLVEEQTLIQYASIPLQKPQVMPAIKIDFPQAEQAVNSSFVLKASLLNWTGSPQKVEYKLEDFSWKPLEMEGNTYSKEIDLTEVYDGIRNMWVRAVDDEGKVYLDRVSFKVNNNEKVKILWQSNTWGGIQHAPSLSEKYLYIGDNSGRVYQVDQKTGKINWEYKTGGSVVGSPLYLDGKVYVGSADGKIYALKAINGSKLWEFQTGGAVVAAPVVFENKVFVGSSDFSMYALDAETGKLDWKFNTENTISSSSAYGKGIIYFGSWDQKFYAVDARTGMEKWHKAIGSQTYYAPAGSSPLFWEDKVFISTPGGKVFAFNWETGEQIWEVSASSGLSSPIIYQGAVIYNTTSGSLYALDPETGENVWQYDTRVSTYVSSPLAQGGNLVLQGIKGRIVSVQPEDKSESWNFNPGETYLYQKGAVNGSSLFIGTLDGRIIALQTEAVPLGRPFPQLAAFTDILDHWARKDLNKLAKMGWVGGFEDGSYRPDQAVTRAQLAAMLSRFLNYQEPGSQFATSFADIEGHWAYQAISAMEEKGIAGGYKDKGREVFRPDNKTTRAEAAVMLARALNLTAPSTGFTSKFADLGGHWAQEAAEALEERGIIGGFAEGDKMVFRPEQNLTRAEIGVLLIRAAN